MLYRGFYITLKWRQYRKYQQIKFKSTNNIRVTIGNVSKVVKPAKHPELVPSGYLPKDIPQSLSHHLQWMLQKDLLGQDIFLIGMSGPSRRKLAFQYLELTRRELEYVALSRDVTENDLKQRREIRGGTAYYIDQCAVKAAIEGRVLILEGIEKAERNVLPVLNNLLENREMQLEDGRFLVHPKRYDKLLQKYSKELLDKWKLVRVSEDFWVIALGLPVPLYRGHPLDPPFRSRFQARNVSPVFKDQLHYLTMEGKDIPQQRVSELLSFAYSLLTPESINLNLPHFPVDNVHLAVKMLDHAPSVPLHELIQKLYPYKYFLDRDGIQSVEESLKTFHLMPKKEKSIKSHIKAVSKSDEHGISFVTLDMDGKSYDLKVLSNQSEPTTVESKEFVPTSYHEKLLSEMVMSHSVHDFCLIGPKGSGKSALVKQFSQILNYDMEVIMLYQDMSSRDLLQQRITLPNGDTSWQLSPLIKAAISGKLAVLDGLHRLHTGTLSVLHRLIHSRDIQLFDGKRLLSHDHYNKLKENYGFTDSELTERGIFCIHPSFRLVALAESAKGNKAGEQWLIPEILTMFLFHTVRPLSLEEERKVIHHTVGQINEKMDQVLSFAHKVRNSQDDVLQSLASSLSTRQLLRIARKLTAYPEHDVYDTISKACLARFLPQMARKAFDRSLEEDGILCHIKEDGKHELHNIIKNASRFDNKQLEDHGEDQARIPDIVFYDNPQHMAILDDMMKDFLLGEHLLLVGNQGVGKNKLVDRFLQLLKRPREYIQLHRDTSVQTLTLQPSVKDGRIIYEDSPLVRAVQKGSVLVVDEADKAPTHVTCILKALVESGEMRLSDGRRILHYNDASYYQKEDVILMHPDFRMIVLANRPGFPFLGNDFYAALGDIFSCYAVDNPSTESEMAMLHQYGPDVPDYLLKKLVDVFGDLRSLADHDLISYPYSTRELVNVVKHIQNFPNDGLPKVLKNVFDFDAYTPEVQEIFQSVFERHGIPFTPQAYRVNITKEITLPKLSLTCQWLAKESSLENIQFETSSFSKKKLSSLRVTEHDFIKNDARSSIFTEQQLYWNLPLSESSIPLDVAVTHGKKPFEDVIHVITANPISLFSCIPYKKKIFSVNLSHLFSGDRGRSFAPHIKLAALGAPFLGWLAVHDKSSNRTLFLDPISGTVNYGNIASLFETVVSRFTRPLHDSQKDIHMFPDFSSKNMLVFYEENGTKICLVDVKKEKTWMISLPFALNSLHAFCENYWILNSQDQKHFFWKIPNFKECGTGSVSEITEKPLGSPLGSIINLYGGGPHYEAILQSSEDKVSPAVLATDNSYASVAVGVLEPELKVEIFTFNRPGSTPPSNFPTILLNNNGQLVRVVKSMMVPPEAKNEQLSPVDGAVSSFLEVVDLKRGTLSYIPLPSASPLNSYASFLASAVPSSHLLSKDSAENVITVDSQGCIRVWETGIVGLDKSLREWKHLLGYGDGQPLQVTVEHQNPNEAVGPKHGKIDPTGAPHVGGNTWAGGTGGRDTAGLGGKGGPYRLDAGHEVYQLSDEEKEAVPEHVKRAAREMGQKAFQQRLREINMSEHDAEMYEQFSKNVKKQVQRLRVILKGLQAKGKERQWIRHQTSGELDDTKLLEGLTGERTIYKQRGEQEPELGSPQEKPKCLRLVVDVSGSMYRFDGYDNRLQRELETVLMVMEAFDGYQQKFQYDIVGHSGEDDCISFVQNGHPPQNDKERLNILKRMHAHSQFCMSGDHTLPAVHHAVKNVIKNEADEHFVIVCSDANLERYGISPESIGELLCSNPDVNAFIIFIGSLGDQAQRISRRLPSNRAFVCLDTKQLPDILQHIFTSTMLQG